MRLPATDINSKQMRILLYIRDSLYNDYHCPTVREICDYMRLSSTSTVQSHLNTLEKFGYIKRAKNKNRSITLVEDKLSTLVIEGFHQKSAAPSSVSHTSTDTFSDEVEITDVVLRRVPLRGQVQAGMPVFATENIEEVLTLPIQLVGNSDCFALRVRGESMINIGFYEDDLLIVRQQNTANNGDIVVARVNDDEATVKRFFREADHIRLQPENDNFEPIITKNCEIAGLVIGLIRDRI